LGECFALITNGSACHPPRLRSDMTAGEVAAGFPLRFDLAAGAIGTGVIAGSPSAPIFSQYQDRTAPGSRSMRFSIWNP
jgi:hypothetical protein